MTPPKPLLTEEECEALVRHVVESDADADYEIRLAQSAAALGARKREERLTKSWLAAVEFLGPEIVGKVMARVLAIEADESEPARCDTCHSDDRATRYAISRPGTYEGPCENDWHNEPKEAP